LVQWRDRFSDRAVRGVVPNLTWTLEKVLDFPVFLNFH
jgi:hypothetical protein